VPPSGAETLDEIVDEAEGARLLNMLGLANG